MSPIQRPIAIVQQPNDYTCGPASIAMVAAAIRPHAPAPSVEDIAKRCGTNPQTGTTHLEMARGLTQANLRWHRGGLNTLDDLTNAIRDNELVLLRTLVDGIKHWVVVDGVSDQGFGIACPSDGRLTWSPDYLLEAWSARDYDCFRVSRRGYHPDPLRPIHDHTLDEFTGKYPRIIREIDFGVDELQIINEGYAFMHSFAADPIHEIEGVDPRYRFFRQPGATLVSQHRIQNMVATDVAGKKALGCFHYGTSVIFPEYRGQGLGALLVMAAYSHGPWRYTGASHFSEAGFAARRRAHALSVERAMDAGIAIRPEVLRSNPLLREALVKNALDSRSASDREARPIAERAEGFGG